MRKSWKTTLGGALSALGLFLESSEEPIISLVGKIFEGVGIFLIGFSARDNNVSSEDAGAR